MLGRIELRCALKTEDSERQNEADHLKTTAAQRLNFFQKKYLEIFYKVVVLTDL